MADKDGDSPLHEALRHHTLWQLRTLQDKQDVTVKKVNRNFKIYPIFCTLFIAFFLNTGYLVVCGLMEFVKFLILNLHRDWRL